MAIPTTWRTKKQRYSLEGAVCPTCHSMMFPPRKQCVQCSHTTSHASTSAADDKQNYYMVFTMPQPTEVALAGDD